MWWLAALHLSVNATGLTPNPLDLNCAQFFSASPARLAAVRRLAQTAVLAPNALGFTPITVAELQTLTQTGRLDFEPNRRVVNLVIDDGEPADPEGALRVTVLHAWAQEISAHLATRITLPDADLFNFALVLRQDQDGEQGKFTPPPERIRRANQMIDANVPADALTDLPGRGGVVLALHQDFLPKIHVGEDGFVSITNVALADLVALKATRDLDQLFLSTYGQIAKRP